MKKYISKETEQNIALLLGVSSVSQIVMARHEEKQKIIREARANRKVKVSCKANHVSSGNPYIMLNAKVDNKGRRV